MRYQESMLNKAARHLDAVKKYGLGEKIVRDAQDIYDYIKNQPAVYESEQVKHKFQEINKNANLLLPYREIEKINLDWDLKQGKISWYDYQVESSAVQEQLECVVDIIKDSKA